MYYEPFGPFDLRAALKFDERDWRARFWKSEVDAHCDGLSSANGVYIFSIKFGPKYTPWYVGKTCTGSGFAGEIFQGHKLNHYFAASEGSRGLPCLHLIARVEKNRGNFCNYSAIAEREIDRLETYLIGMALARNPNLRNKSKTKFNRLIDIAGVIGPKYSGRPRQDAQTLKNVLGLAD